MFEKWQCAQRRGIFSSGKQFFRRNPDGFQGNIVPPRRKKNRRLGMLTFFKQGLTIRAEALIWTEKSRHHVYPTTNSSVRCNDTKERNVDAICADRTVSQTNAEVLVHLMQARGVTKMTALGALRHRWLAECAALCPRFDLVRGILHFAQNGGEEDAANSPNLCTALRHGIARQCLGELEFNNILLIFDK
ncbi:MAG: hypothetical protein HFF17_11475 [Oscillospiraceae bacterium]|nr:hypothetical protein [Oscillospiraceae bacterium]